MLLISKPLRPPEITIRHCPTTKRRSPHLDQNIDVIWRNLLEEKIREGKRLWDAELYRLESFSLQGSILHLDISTISVKEVQASRRVPDEYGHGRSYRCHNIFVASLIRSLDAHYVFGRSSATTMGGGRVELIGGALSKSEAEIHDAGDIFDAAAREIEEEINILPIHMKSMSLCAILETNEFGIGLIFEVDLRIRMEDVRDRFFRRKNDEISDIIIVCEKDAANFLSFQSGYLPMIGRLPNLGHRRS